MSARAIGPPNSSERLSSGDFAWQVPAKTDNQFLSGVFWELLVRRGQIKALPHTSWTEASQRGGHSDSIGI